MLLSLGSSHSWTLNVSKRKLQCICDGQVRELSCFVTSCSVYWKEDCHVHLFLSITLRKVSLSVDSRKTGFIKRRNHCNFILSLCQKHCLIPNLILLIQSFLLSTFPKHSECCLPPIHLMPKNQPCKHIFKHCC